MTASGRMDSNVHKENDMVMYFGYEPGTDGTHGVAALQEDPSGHRRCLAMATLQSGEDALRWLIDRIDRAPERAGIGISTPTEWSLAPTGDRPAECFLRARLGAEEVVEPHWLVGAMLLNGMGVLIRLREQWSDLFVTETRPWPLYATVSHEEADFDLLGIDMCRWLSRRVDVDGLMAEGYLAWDGPKWGALMSAWACAEGLRAGWRDLHDAQHLARVGTILRPAGTTKYLWPHETKNGSGRA